MSDKTRHSSEMGALKRGGDGPDSSRSPAHTRVEWSGEHGEGRVAPPIGSPAPEAIGPYRIIELLGQGGMGSVYLAEQTAPMQRRVAIKLTNAAANTERMLRRFDVERQALARMNHPNIAQVYDAGADDRGQPFFVMEYVPGSSITEYCDAQRCDVRRRLELMLAVCDGVHHAHQKGVIHRDLKPSNVLVAPEGDGVPKIIDFGIAKAVDEPLTDRTLLTGDRMLGTPAYMSPERITANGDIDTRADIYSLGVMLYEILTGELPHPTDDSGYYELASKVMTEDAPKPSDRVTDIDGERLRTVARRRSTDSVGLRRRLRGDLDWITMRAMEKDRSRRYESAAALAADIRRHLRHEPVEAGPPSASYRMLRFVQRYTAGVVSAVLVVLALVAGIVGTTLQARRANREAERANREALAASQVSEFLIGLFEVSNPTEARGETITAREILDRGAERIAVELDDQPMTRAQLQETVGSVYASLGLLTAARAQFESALEARRGTPSEAGPEAIRDLRRIGGIQGMLDDFSGAEATLNRALSLAQALDPPDPALVADLHTSLAILYKDTTRFDLALAELETAQSLLSDIEDTTLLTDVLNTRGNLLARLGRPEEGETLLQRAVELVEAEENPELPRVIGLLSNLGGIQAELGKLEEAEASMQRSLSLAEQVFEPDHPMIASIVLGLATLFGNQERYDEAEPLFLRVLAIRERTLGPDHRLTGLALYNIASLHQARGEFEQALPHAERAHEIWLEALGERHLYIGYALNLEGDLFSALERYDEAERSYLEAQELYDEVVGPAHPSAIINMRDHAEMLRETGRVEEAAAIEARADELEAGGEEL
jgi:non-specific serine/threonine protein kinase/serine/threonine-protein kinase